jgi:hypothetical protein
MPEYMVHLTNIGVVADSPERAAKIVHEWLLDPSSTWLIEVTNTDAELVVNDHPGEHPTNFDLYESFTLTGNPTENLR